VIGCGAELGRGGAVWSGRRRRNEADGGDFEVGLSIGVQEFEF
jgi:hypothetical protein